MLRQVRARGSKKVSSFGDQRSYLISVGPMLLIVGRLPQLHPTQQRAVERRVQDPRPRKDFTKPANNGMVRLEGHTLRCEKFTSDQEATKICARGREVWVAIAKQLCGNEERAARLFQPRFAGAQATFREEALADEMYPLRGTAKSS